MLAHYLTAFVLVLATVISIWQGWFWISAAAILGAALIVEFALRYEMLLRRANRK